MMTTHKELEDFLTHANSILELLEYAQTVSNKTELEIQLQNPDVWTDNTKAGHLNQELASVNKQIDKHDSLKSQIENLQVAFELDDEPEYQKIQSALHKIINEIQNSQFLNGKFDASGAILTLHAGAGGIDAQDWTSMMCAMYQTFAKKQGWSCNTISLSLGEEAGVKSATLEINGENVFGLLKEEAGVHRLVRVSPFNSGGTRETSFALVEVLPAGLDQHIDIVIDEKDLRVDTFMSSGKGGQGVNTTYSAVRLVHLPTGIAVASQEQRNQLQNKERAMQILKNKLAAIELRKQKEFEKEMKGGLVSAEWGSQIRSYVLHPYKMVKDHRSGWETADVMDVIEHGHILDIIWSVKKIDKS